MAPQVKALLQGQLVVSAKEADGSPADATGVQLQGVLDELLFHDGPLGASVSGQAVDVALWAPTAQQVWGVLRSRRSHQAVHWAVV
jgi:hypothetical protein